MYAWLIAKFYDNIMADAEEKILRDWRSSLLKGLSGEVLELGCGTGANLPFYPAAVSSLVLAEPDKYMRQQLTVKLPKYSNLQPSILEYDGENIALPDNSIDAVVCTLVLCTVKDPQKILSEAYRVLRPQGKLLFIEHVAAVNNEARLRLQRFFEPIWKIIGRGCHLTRNTEQNIIQAGFQFQEINRQSMRGMPAIVRPSIRGCAVK